MSVKVERLEHNMAKLTVEVPAADFVAAIKTAYNKSKNRFNIPGFRKGKAPQNLVEKMYGKEVFYDDAANEVLQNSYPEAAKESGLDIVSAPQVELVQIEKGQDFIYAVTVAVKPEVKLGAYKGLEIPKFEATVSEADIDAALVREQEKNARVVTVEDRAVESGDTVVLDYAGTVDGVAFDGGTATDYELVIGSGAFIPGFEDQLIGVNTEEEKDIVVTFPEDYHADLAGKEAVFKCTVHKITKKEMPELNDEFAQEVSEYDTLAEYREEVKGHLQEAKDRQVDAQKKEAAVSKLVELSEMDIPEAMIDTRVDQMFNDQANRMQSQGFPMDMYLQYMGTTAAEMKKNMRQSAEAQIKGDLVLEAVAAAENFEITDDAINAEMTKMAEAYKIDPQVVIDAMTDYEKDQMRKDLSTREALKFLIDNAVEVEKKDEAEKAE
ncbi:MAG: trigger factor [Lachnospiraceae bacterium]|nr:trigger factor [Lachnospiraceae bacterium]